nr:unnamed protein product [Digitaria exilis]
MNTPGNAGMNDLKYGAGQLNPVKARDPGLVYEASEGDYITMLATTPHSYHGMCHQWLDGHQL